MASFASRAMFVFDGQYASVGVELHDIRSAAHAMFLRPERQSAFDADAPFSVCPGEVCAFMRLSSSQCEQILLEHLLDMNQSALPWAVGEVFERRNRNPLVFGPYLLFAGAFL